MIKTILVPTDGSECAMIGVRYAVALAKQYKAKLFGLHVVDIKLLEGPFLRDISASLGTAPYVNYQGNIAMLLEERGNNALALFEKNCQEAGVSYETRQMTGVIARCIVEQSDLCDIIVMSRSGESGQWLDGVVGSTTASVVRRATQPVLVTGTDIPGNRAIVIAYDGSAHAKRSLQSACRVATTWKLPCHVLVVGSEESRPILEEAKTYIESHEIEAQYELRSGDPSEAIVTFAKERNADLLIMGAYGHTKVRELVVGSTTAYALNHAPCPLLLSR